MKNETYTPIVTLIFGAVMMIIFCETVLLPGLKDQLKHTQQELKETKQLNTLCIDQLGRRAP